MKKLIFLLFLIPHFLHAQANIAGLLFASNFAGWNVPQGNQGQMSWSSPSFCTVTSGGVTFRAFAVGVPVTLNDAETPANTEIITPIQVNYSGFGCSISAHTINSHKSFYFTTATAGLGEALTFAGSAKYQIVLTPDWTRLGGTTAIVTGSTVGNTNVTIMDQRTAPGLAPYTWSGSAYVAGSFTGGGGGSQKVIYASKIAGVTTGVAVVPGSSASETIDSAAALNTAISGGNIDLEVDSGFALSTSLLLSSNTTVHCVAPQYGFIMQTGANLYVLANAHQNAPTTASGTGGFLPSNITDKNIKVDGCTLNENSVQSVTGTLSGGAPHTISGSTGLFVTGVFFDGVQGLTFTNNEIYDSGVWAFFASNTLNDIVSNNYIHQPTPITASKFTDGIHFIGPEEYLFVNNNNITTGDDSLALNAEDGNRTGLSGPGFNASQWPGVKWGPITDVQANNNTFNNGYYGLRVQDGSELIDRVFVSNTGGNLCGNTGTFQGISTFGPGNVGKVTIDGWTVQTDGTCNTFSQPYNFSVNENVASLQIKGVNIQNPGVNWPLFTQFGGAIGNLSIRDWDLNTASSTVSNLFALTSGTISQLAISGLNWNDGVGTGAVLSGAAVPSAVTCSNYAGPNRILAGGFSPAVQNGDCFTNTYASVPPAIHRWPMNEGTGSTLHDTIGSTNLAATSVTWAVTAGMGASAVAQFNGTSSFANAASVDSTLNFNGTQPMTVCYWSASATAISATVIGNLETASSYQGWEAGYGGGGPEANFLVVGAVTTNQLTLTSTAASTGGSYCWTYSGNLSPSGLLLYANGALQSTTTTTNTLTSGSTSTSAVYVGSRNNGTNFYTGALGYLYVWNQVLTAPQIHTFNSAGPQ